MANSDYSIYQKPKSWISRLSIRARGIVNKSQQQNDDQVSILSAPEILPSPASSVTSMNPTDDDENCSTFVTPSPSSSTSSCGSIFSVKQSEQSNQRRLSENLKTQQEQQNHILPPSPTLTAYDKLRPVPLLERNNRRYPSIASTKTPILLPLENNSYFSSDRPLPTKRRTPGRSRHSSAETNNRAPHDSFFLKNNTNEQQIRHSAALEQLAHDALTYFVDASSGSSLSRTTFSYSSPTNPEQCDGKNADPMAKLVEKLKSRLTSTSSSVHPSVLKLAQDVMTFMNETPPLTSECQQLKPKLEVCLLIHGKDVN